MNPQLLPAILAVCASFVLVGLNALFVAAEFAIVKVRRTRLEELAGQGIAAARISILCVNQLDEYLSATQLGITLVSLGLGWIGEHAFSNLFFAAFPHAFPIDSPATHAVAAAGSFFILTMLHVVLGELVPKSIAIQDAERATLWLSPPLRFFYRISRPLITMFTWLANFILHRVGYANFEEPPLSEQELKLVMKESKEDGVISDSEAQIITRAFEFSDKRAAEIMVPREQVNFLSLKLPLEENLARVKKRMHTRFPLCHDDFDNIVGVIHMKDVWPVLLTRFSNQAFQSAARAAMFVEPGLKQDQLMRLFQSCRAHMAIVRDPGTGKCLGIVTMEDVLESLVGDIRDEHGN